MQQFFLTIFIVLISGCGNSNSSHADTNNNNKTNTNSSTLNVDFQHDIMPLLKAKCLRCHGNSGNFHVTTPLETYRLLLYDAPRVSSGYTHFIVSNKLESSLLYKKALNIELHGGGSVLAYDSNESLLLQNWILGGTIYDKKAKGLE